MQFVYEWIYAYSGFFFYFSYCTFKNILSLQVKKLSSVGKIDLGLNKRQLFSFGAYLFNNSSWDFPDPSSFESTIVFLDDQQLKTDVAKLELEKHSRQQLNNDNLLGH